MKSILITTVAVLFFSAITSAKGFPFDEDNEYGFTSIADFLSLDSSALIREYEQNDLKSQNVIDDHDCDLLFRRAAGQGPDVDGAIMAIMRMNTDQAADALFRLAQSTDRFVSGRSIWALDKMETSLGVPRMAALLDSPNVNIEKKAIILSKLQSHPGTEVELAVIKQVQNVHLEQYALSTLGVIGTDQSLDLLRQYAKKSVGPTKSIATHSLGQVEARLAYTGESEYKLPEYPIENHESTADEDASDPELKGMPRADMCSSGVVNEDHSLEIEAALSKIRMLEKKMWEIQNQVLLVAEVKEAMASYTNLLNQKIDELVAAGNENFSYLPEEQAKGILRQKASQDTHVREAKQKTRRLMINEAQKIMPNVEELETELITLIDRVISLKWPGSEGVKKKRLLE